MSAQIIHPEASIQRISDGKEKPWDRKYVFMVSVGTWRREWRQAKLTGDYDKMDYLNRTWETLHCL